MEQHPVRHLLIAGGDTAHALLARLGVERLEVAYAALAGMPTCRAHFAPTAAGNHAPLWITLKAGNHGDLETLALLMQANREYTDFTERDR